METGQLAAALRNKAAEVRGVNATTETEDQTLRDAADLLRVLAHVVDGKPLAKAFGSPGDWGYETAIGADERKRNGRYDGQLEAERTVA
jgi:hypothetical protein